MREMRRSDRAIEINEAKTMLQLGEFGILSYVNTEGIPIGIPLNYFYDGIHLYFHSGNEGEKIDGILKNQDISFTVVGKTEVLPEKFGTIYESVILKGKAEIANAEDKHKALEGLIDKYSSQFKEAGLKYIKAAFDKTTVIKVTCTQISGKARRKGI